MFVFTGFANIQNIEI